MSAQQILRANRPMAAVGAFALMGSGMWVARSYLFSNIFAESGEPQNVFSGVMGSSLRLESTERLNHNTRRLRFEFPNSAARSGLTLTSSVLVASWPQGKWLPVLRPYTPISPLDERGHIDLMVKQYPNGKASTYLHSMSPGESLYFVAALKGHTWTPNKYSHITLVAGGAGITPMHQLIQGVLRNPEDKTQITLVFGVNSDEDVLLKKEFDDFEEQFPGRFKAIYTVSKPVESSPFRKGYITEALLEAVTVDPREENTKIFVCGPPAMEKALLGTRGFLNNSDGGILQRLGYRKDQIHQF